jgi:predicted phage terminase large subunit-like protein
VSIPLGDLTIDEDLLKQALSTAPLSERARLIALIEELKRRQNREFAQQNFLAFVQQVWPSFIYGRHHARMAQEFEKVVSGENKRLIINLGPRHAVQIDEPIPTPTGWKTMQTLQVGDDVFGQDGKPTKVIGKSEVFHNQQLYRVTTDDGHSLDVDGEHLWTVRMKRGTGVFRDYTTEQLWLRQQGIRVKASRGGGVHILHGKITGDVRLPMLPQMEGSIYPEKQLLIDPYVLGLWLGDGASAQSHITSHDDDAVFVRKQFEDRGYVTTDQKTKYLFGILGLKVALRELGVLNNKHIPEDYLTASLEQRRDLLKGLMDSDGNVSKKGQCFFAQKSLGFITQVRELLCSLGIKNSMSSTEAKIGDVSYGTHHRLSFYATNICNLPRKEDRTLKTERTFGRYIKVEKLNATGDTQCIKVENEDGLFLAGKGYLCTHNTKSEFGSYLLPAWYLGKNPDKKIIQCSHTAELAVGFGRKVRNLVGSAAYQEIFPGVELQQDSKAAGRWNTSAGGSYFAIGVSGAVTGIGGDIIIIDDPHSEQEAAIAASNPEIYDKVYEWYTSGPRQRLQPGGSVIVIQTRWSKRDLTGQVKQKELEGGGDKWKVVELPAILPSGKPLWPEFWSIEELEATRNAIDVSKWQAQYQQNPTSEEGAIVKRDWWQRWEQDTPPPTSFILQAWDTAFEKHNRADYSACTTWGIFNLPDEKGIDRANIILLDAKRDRLEFPQLKEKVLGEYRYWEPDSLIIEKKASGAPLIYELRHMGIVVSDFTPTRGNDKISRLNAISDIFSSGRVWAPNTRWADEVIDEVAAFPAGQHDDYVDCVSMSLALFRKGGYISTKLDREDEEYEYRRKTSNSYY